MLVANDWTYDFIQVVKLKHKGFLLYSTKLALALEVQSHHQWWTNRPQVSHRNYLLSSPPNNSRVSAWECNHQRVAMHYSYQDSQAIMLWIWAQWTNQLTVLQWFQRVHTEITMRATALWMQVSLTYQVHQDLLRMQMQIRWRFHHFYLASSQVTNNNQTNNNSNLELEVELAQIMEWLEERHQQATLEIVTIKINIIQATVTLGIIIWTTPQITKCTSSKINHTLQTSLSSTIITEQQDKVSITISCRITSSSNSLCFPQVGQNQLTHQGDKVNFHTRPCIHHLQEIISPPVSITICDNHNSFQPVPTRTTKWRKLSNRIFSSNLYPRWATHKLWIITTTKEVSTKLISNNSSSIKHFIRVRLQCGYERRIGKISHSIWILKLRFMQHPMQASNKLW